MLRSRFHLAALALPLLVTTCDPIRRCELGPRSTCERGPIRFEARAQPYVSEDLPDCPATSSASERSEPAPSCVTLEACRSALESYSCDGSCGGMDSNAQAISRGFVRLGERSVPVLVRVLEHGDHDPQALAAYCLHDLKTRARAATPALIRAYQRGNGWALNALFAVQDRRATPTLLDAFVRNPEGLRSTAGDALVKLGEVAALAELLRRPTLDTALAGGVEHKLAKSLERTPSLVPVLLRIVADEHVSMLGRSTAASVLPAVGRPHAEAVKVLLDARKSAQPSLRASLDSALVGFGEPGATGRLLARVKAYDFRKDQDTLCRRVESFVSCDLDMFDADAFLYPTADKDAALELAWLFWKSGTADRQRIALKIAGQSDRSEAVELVREALSSSKWNRVLEGCKSANELGARAAPLRTALRQLASSHWSNAIRESAQLALGSIAGRQNDNPNQLGWPHHLPERCRAQGMLPAVEWSRRWWIPACDNRIRIPSNLPASARDLDGLSAAMRLRGGWLVGTDRGEWGASSSGRQRTVRARCCRSSTSSRSNRRSARSSCSADSRTCGWTSGASTEWFAGRTERFAWSHGSCCLAHRSACFMPLRQSWCWPREVR